MAMIAEHLALASDPSTPQETLLSIWGSSRSVKVRKAVATNPNAGPQVLKAASRLYFEDVIGSPGFEMLELFDDDPWLIKISTAYKNPKEFIENYGSSWRFLRNPTERDQFCWAILLSPQLTAGALDTSLASMSSGALKRALKSERVRTRIRSVYADALITRQVVFFFTVENLIKLHREHVLNNLDLLEGLKRYGHQSLSISKYELGKFVKKLHSEYNSTTLPHVKAEIVAIIARVYFITRGYMKSFLKKIVTGDQVNTCDWGGELYASVLNHMMGIEWISKTSSNGGWTSDVRTVASIVGDYAYTTYIRPLHYLEDGKKDDDEYAVRQLKGVRTFLMSTGVDERRFSALGIKQHVDMYLLKGLEKCDIRTQLFFFRAQGSKFINVADKPAYELANNLNNKIYAEHGLDPSLLLFDRCGITGTIHLNKS